MFSSYKETFDYLATIWPWADPKKTRLIEAPAGVTNLVIKRLENPDQYSASNMPDENSPIIDEYKIYLEDQILPDGSTRKIGASEEYNTIAFQRAKPTP
jgi:hypothetical protein